MANELKLLNILIWLAETIYRTLNTKDPFIRT